MSHFAEIDDNGRVLRVIVIEADKLATGRWGNLARWVQTSYTGSMRKNYAGVGYTYDRLRDAFIPPKPSADAVLDERTCRWIEPARVIPAMTGNF